MSRDPHTELDTDMHCGCPRSDEHTYHVQDCPEQDCACEDAVEGAYRTLECTRPSCPMYGGC